MMFWLVYSTPSNITGFLGFFQYLNTVCGGWFGVLILIGLFGVSLLSSYSQDFKGSAMKSLALVTVLGGAFAAMDLVSIKWALLSPILLGFILLYDYFTERAKD